MARVRERERANAKRRKTQEERGETSNSSSQGERAMGGGDQTSNLPTQIEIGGIETPNPLPPQKEILGAGETSTCKSKREMAGEETSNPLPPQKEIRVSINPCILECSICFDPLCSPLYQCMKNGHVMCPTCWPKVQYESPTCDDPVGSRNNALENMLESIHLPCTYTYLGCRKSVSYSQMQRHTETCEFGSSLCSIPGYANKAFSGVTSNLLPPQNETGEIRGGETSIPLPQNVTGEREHILVTINSVLLECSICLNPLCSPLYECMDGHVACPYCWLKIQYKCPTCYTPIVSRNLALENVLESVHVPCTYAYLGCRKSDSYSQMQVHIDTCDFRPTLCPIPGCAHKAFLGEWPGHLLEHHKFPWNNFIYGEAISIVFNQGHHYFTLFGPDKNMFLLVNEPIINVGNALSLYCFDMPHLYQNVLSYEIMVDTDSGMVHLKSKVHSIKEWKRGEERGSFLLVPLRFSLSEEMKVHVLINKKLDVISIN